MGKLQNFKLIDQVERVCDFFFFRLAQKGEYDCTKSSQWGKIAIMALESCQKPWPILSFDLSKSTRDWNIVVSLDSFNILSYNPSVFASYFVFACESPYFRISNSRKLSEDDFVLVRIHFTVILFRFFSLWSLTSSTLAAIFMS